MSSSSNTPCAACKLQRRKCTQECVFAPYFPPDQPQKFAIVHRVYGASNVAKLLGELSAAQREDAVNSLAYEAEYRLRDPVYGCVGLISILRHRLEQVQHDLNNARKELATFVGPSAVVPVFPPHTYLGGGNLPSSSMLPMNMQTMMVQQNHSPQYNNGGSFMLIEPPPPQQYHNTHHHHQQHQLMETQNISAIVGRSYESQSNEIGGFSNGVEPAASITANGYNQISGGSLSPSLGLAPYECRYELEEQHPENQQQNHNLQFKTQVLCHPLQHSSAQRSRSEDGRPFC